MLSLIWWFILLLGINFCLVVDSLKYGAHKRLKRKELDPQTCVDNFDIQRDKIIRTEESRSMGAKYLNEIDIGTMEECHRLCCETETCDVFVFDERVPGSCYLFHCGPPENFKCKFTQHSNFTSGVLALSRSIAELEDQARLTKHEQDLASLRRPMPESTTKPKPTVSNSPSKSLTANTVHETRRCSRYQFECHTGGECIAIYNACDGIPQCADGSDEAPELGCPSQVTTARSTTALPRMPQRELSPDQEYKPKVESEEVIIRQPVQEMPNWSNKDVDKNKVMAAPHIFSRKTNLLSNNEIAQMPQYVPFIPVQDSQWGRRQWPQAVVPENDGRVMYRYPAPEWKQPVQLPYQSYDPQSQGPIESQVVQMEPVHNLMPMVSSPGREKFDQIPIMGAGQDRDKMWAVPQTPILNPDPPMYQPPKTMPERPIMYSNQQGTLRDSPKKGFSLMKTAEERASPEKSPTETQTTIKPKSIEENKTIKKAEAVDNKTVKTEDKHIDEKAAEEPAVTKEKPIKHEMKHDYYKNVEEEHEGFSEKPPGAIFLLILGILMTSIMATMLVCRIRVMRWRVRTRGGGKAYDADYLVNGMYL